MTHQLGNSAQGFKQKFEAQLNYEIQIRQKGTITCLPDIRVSGVAVALNMDVSNLRRLCHRHYKQSPKSLIDQYRIKQALTLLARGVRPSIIADKLGFYEHKTFSTVFKKHTGMAPSEFAKCSPMA
ncbi:helix-turn-helix transcriptional regulator [Alteromonas sp. A079]|uniref:helix-turn-helix transcriptional regulator n=1 Tax=Alteromonas sp. A079 TaxID=3410268 RepID=UPI003B9E76A5